MTTHYGPDVEQERRSSTPPPPGEQGLLSAALAIGILLMAIQLWILTVALEDFQRGEFAPIYALTGISALIFVGGILMLWALKRKPTVRRTSVPSSSSDQELPH